jgi:CAF1 family ribonuclease
VAFIAIDEEMTGISVTTGRPRKDQRPCDRFPELKEAADRYNIIQLGVALFTLATDDAPASSSARRGYEVEAVRSGAYVVRRYNFYTFPAAPGWNQKGRDICMDPSAVAFLKQHNMSFDTWTGSGITYSTTDAAQSILKKFIEQQTSSSSRTGKSSSRVDLRRPEDIAFFGKAMVSRSNSIPVYRYSPHCSLRLVCANGLIRQSSKWSLSVMMEKSKTQRKVDSIFYRRAIPSCEERCINTLNRSTHR